MACKAIDSKEFEEKYMKIMKEEIKTAKSVVHKKGSWKNWEEKTEHLIYWRKWRESKFNMFKGVVKIMNCTPAEFCDFYMEPTKKGDQDMIKKLAKTTKEVKVLKEFKEDELYAMRISVSSGSKLASDREFFVIRYIEKTDDRAVIFTMSVLDEDEDLLPVIEGQVRGKMYFIVDMIVPPKNKDRIFVSNILHTEPKGSMPAIVFNKVSTRSCLSIVSYQKHFLESRKKQ